MPSQPVRSYHTTKEVDKAIDHVTEATGLTRSEIVRQAVLELARTGKVRIGRNYLRFEKLNA